jgi:transcription initiation factor IIE alpha subunit
MIEKNHSASGGSIGGRPVTIDQELNLDEFWRVMRKLSGPKALLVIDALLTGEELTRKDLREKTGLLDPQLNHELIELGRLNLIIKNEDAKTYQITVYCKLFMYVLDSLLSNLAQNRDVLLNAAGAIDPAVLERMISRRA